MREKYIKKNNEKNVKKKSDFESGSLERKNCIKLAAGRVASAILL